MRSKNKRRYVACTALLLGVLLNGCSRFWGSTTESVILPGDATIPTVATEPLVGAIGDANPTESVQATDVAVNPSETELSVAGPPTTEPPVTEPPATEPPVTEPPATEPPVTEPPATELPVTEPPATEPPVTEPPIAEPPAIEPPATEPPATEPPAEEPPATELPPTEPPATEPPATEPESKETVPMVVLDYAAAMAYGNQYAADTYGYYIDLTLDADNAGFEFPYSASVHGIMEKGGQEYLYLRITRKVDSLAETLSVRGISKAYINCHIYEDVDGVVQFYVYYG